MAEVERHLKTLREDNQDNHLNKLSTNIRLDEKQEAEFLCSHGVVVTSTLPKRGPRVQFPV